MKFHHDVEDVLRHAVGVRVVDLLLRVIRGKPANLGVGGFKELNSDRKLPCCHTGLATTRPQTSQGSSPACYHFNPPLAQEKELSI